MNAALNAPSNIVRYSETRNLLQENQRVDIQLTNIIFNPRISDFSTTVSPWHETGEVPFILSLWGLEEAKKVTDGAFMGQSRSNINPKIMSRGTTLATPGGGASQKVT